jgi:hypothetical protein
VKKEGMVRKLRSVQHDHEAPEKAVQEAIEGSGQQKPGAAGIGADFRDQGLRLYVQPPAPF